MDSGTLYEAGTDNLRVNALVNAVEPGGSILDVGCVQHDVGASTSEEWVHDHLQKIADELIGLDYLEDEVKRLNEQGYDIIHADAQNFDLDRRFDTIVAGEIIEHLSNFGGFLDSVHAHLKPTGTLVMTTPNPWAFHRFKQALLYDDVSCNSEHTCWLDERTIKQLLCRHDFKIENLEYVKPSQNGISRVLYNLGRETIGGTSILVSASTN